MRKDLIQKQNHIAPVIINHVVRPLSKRTNERMIKRANEDEIHKI